MKKLLSLLLTFGMICSLSSPAFASEQSSSYSLDNNPRADIYRSVVEDFSSMPQLYWTSGDSENNYGSHGLITLMGISVASVRNNAIDDYFTPTRSQWLIEYSVMPDIDERGTLNALFDCHFYGPNEKNYWGGTDTAYTRFKNHYNTAVIQYRSGNYLVATQELGRAIHFISDINNPHHANNADAVRYPSHTQFEDYVEEARENNIVNPANIPLSYLSAFSSKSLKTIANESGAFARQYFSYANSMNGLVLDRSRAVLAINPTYCNAQKVTAGVIYKFCDEVGMF